MTNGPNVAMGHERRFNRRCASNDFRSSPNSGRSVAQQVHLVAKGHELRLPDACSRLGLVDKSDGATQLVAKKIIEAAERGERDPARMVSAVLTHFAH